MKLPVLFLLVYSLSQCKTETIYEGMNCNNGCTDNSSHSDQYWCNQRRAGEGEDVFRCAPRTWDGGTCVSDCGAHPDKEDDGSTWCRTNYHKNEWEKCGREGKTINGKDCLKECNNNGKDYWWCYTAEDKSWDYCSPPTQVIRVSYTSYGLLCKNPCDRHGEDYLWCWRSLRWLSSKKTDKPNWGYCSRDSKHTRYDEPCTNECAERGENYYWCNTKSSWDYCSPRVESNWTLTNKGIRCVGVCDPDWGYCAAYGRAGRDNWFAPCVQGKEEYVYNYWLYYVFLILVIIVFFLAVCCFFLFCTK